jgi:hypothetical protein
LPPNVDACADHALWARKCAKIVNKRKQLVPLELRPWQVRFQEEIAKQRAAGVPIRGIILKARQLGFSTDIQATFMQECTLNGFEAALTVAHDLDTAGKLFEIGHRIYHNLPDDPRLKPALTHERDSKGGMKYMRWANGSTYDVETAGDKLGGRGQTPEQAAPLGDRALPGDHARVAARPAERRARHADVDDLQRVDGQRPQPLREATGTTPCRACRATSTSSCRGGRSPSTRSRSTSLEEREAFEQTLGEGEIGEDEPMLLERFPHLTLEQLNWRRFAIRTKTNHDPVLFKQEYPSYPEEAFKATGRHVFSSSSPRACWAASRTLEQLEAADPTSGSCAPSKTTRSARARARSRCRRGRVRPDRGDRLQPLRAPDVGDLAAPGRARRARPPAARGAADLPPRPVRDRHRRRRRGGDHFDRRHRLPRAPDHRPRDQGAAARWRGRIATHELTYEAMLAGVYFNNALLAVEVTGGWGGPIARGAWRQYGYANVFRRQKIDGRNAEDGRRARVVDRHADAPGDHRQPDRAARRGHRRHPRPLTADELTTFVYNEKGKPVPEADHFSDLIMALMIAKFVARIRRPRPNRKAPAEARPPALADSRYG